MRRAAPFAILVSLAGCAAATDSPSLAPRPIETRSEVPTPVAAVPTPAADAPLMTKLDALVAEAKAGDAQFERARVDYARALANAGGAVEGSEPWIARETGRSALSVAHQRTRDALREIEALQLSAIEKDAAGSPGAGLAEIEAARMTVAGLVERQTTRLATSTRTGFHASA